MKDQDIIKQLHKVRNIKPRLEWKNSSREFLVLQAQRSTFNSQQSKVGQSNAWIYFEVFFALLRQKAMQPATVLLAMFALVFVSTLSVNAAFYSLPGTTLYRVKIALEQTQLAFVRNDTKAAEFKAELAQKRVEELEKIVAQPENAQKKAKVAAVIKQFKKEVKAVKSDVDKLTPTVEKADANIVFNIAISVDSSTSQLVESLSGQQGEGVSGEVEELADSLIVSLQDKLNVVNERIAKFVQSGAFTDEVQVVQVMARAIQDQIDKKEVEIVLENLVALKEKVDALENSVSDTNTNDTNNDSEIDAQDGEQDGEKQEFETTPEVSNVLEPQVQNP